MRRYPFTKWYLALAALLAASGFAGGFGSGTTASREPGSRATSVRRLTLLEYGVRPGVARATARRPEPGAGAEQLVIVDARLSQGDVEIDCTTGRLIRRKSMDELITDSAGLVLAPFSSR